MTKVILKISSLFFNTVSENYLDKKVIIIADNAKYHHFKGINEYLEGLKNM